jgi:DnaJ-class molecular chaperone
MKSKEEIEKMAEFQFPSAITKEGCRFGFIKGYTQCQEDMAKLSEWQLCPKCFGEGIVQNVGTSSSMYRTCPVCNGNKTLIKPII